LDGIADKARIYHVFGTFAWVQKCTTRSANLHLLVKKKSSILCAKNLHKIVQHKNHMAVKPLFYGIGQGCKRCKGDNFEDFSMKMTRRKTKVVGTQQYIEAKTGELCEMNVISIEERDANFHKIWLGHIIHSLDDISNQKMRLAFWLLDHMNGDNQITLTQRQIADKSGFSIDTVKRTLKALVDNDFMIRFNIGVYQINPDFIFKGGQGKRLNVLIEYNDTREARANTVPKTGEGLK